MITTCFCNELEWGAPLTYTLFEVDDARRLWNLDVCWCPWMILITKIPDRNWERMWMRLGLIGYSMERILCFEIDIVLSKLKKLGSARQWIPLLSMFAVARLILTWWESLESTLERFAWQYGADYLDTGTMTIFKDMKSKGYIPMCTGATYICCIQSLKLLMKEWTCSFYWRGGPRSLEPEKRWTHFI